MRKQTNPQNSISNLQQISNIHYKFIPKITFKPYYKFNIYHKIQHFIILF
nr:MAG TPA: hypothetical protein [Crassvirales sp.]